MFPAAAACLKATEGNEFPVRAEKAFASNCSIIVPFRLLYLFSVILHHFYANVKEKQGAEAQKRAPVATGAL